jgi:hypothetical protein
VVRELLEARIVRTGEPERAELLASDHLFMRASFPPRSNSPLAAGRLPLPRQKCRGPRSTGPRISAPEPITANALL